mmetsp:Transcript_22181/g.44872  ORF Transcript_22181/g.44872 Transcript_22181/m.44872 type:complete len:225 (-) Transcript_22181:394-1068(-)|eukprot:CAMPEP_0183319798 /NCGR_PEP_ID=MMETSP0160_2-20130417/64627_1 /TAXON_ID=2839 ORGANISM="Odontella Sinensis, Strain Grunow 1884" /NCGR_SAMPLE_ID=MMETSP0160_2 /ASSEMBLY_ACC=CAM_ASM_000250 /LENGTH=224 /DNA_ID=CAMNT_0025486361 /DNA_START=42 /DNA_END=716 /DNA_ORIENTATION=+
MTASPNQVFAFLSASSLLESTGNELELNHVHKEAHREPTQRFFPMPDFSDDEVSSACSQPSVCSQSSFLRTNRHRHPIKSILKPVSAYGEAKNPKPLRRGFQSMMELASLAIVPEGGASASCEVPSTVTEENVGPAVTELSRSVSFISSEIQQIRRVDSLSDLASDRGDIWFQKNELKSFVTSELTRRQKKGIKCMVALCPEAGFDDDEEDQQRPINYPKGFRR